MTTRTGCVILCVAPLLAGSAARAAEAQATAWRPEGVRVTASASPTRVTVGDPVRYVFSVSAPEGLDIDLPPAAARAGDFSMRETGRASRLDSKERRGEVTAVYDLRVYETGEKEIPPFTAVVRDRGGRSAEVDGGAVAVTVESVLDADPQGIRDIKPPIALRRFPARLAAILAVGAGALALAIALILRRRRRRREAAAASPRPPHEVAREELRRLRAMNLPGAGRVVECYVRLSGIARRYIEARFGLRAPDRTTEEFLAEAARGDVLDARAQVLIGDFLERCDLVKFARYGPTAGEVDGAFEAAERFVEETARGRETEDGRRGGGA